MVMGFTGGVDLLPVPVVVVPVVPEPEAGFVAAVIGAVVEATVPPGDGVAPEEVFPVASMPCERSIVPALGGTSAVAVSDSAEVAAALLEPDPPPQAARVSVVRVHRRTLRI